MEQKEEAENCKAKNPTEKFSFLYNPFATNLSVYRGSWYLTFEILSDEQNKTKQQQMMSKIKQNSKWYLTSTLLWMELNCMHISPSNRCYKFTTIIACRWNPIFVVIWLWKNKKVIIKQQVKLRICAVQVFNSHISNGEYQKRGRREANILAWHGKSEQNKHGDFQHHPKFQSLLWYPKHSSQYVVLWSHLTSQNAQLHPVSGQDHSLQWTIKSDLFIQGQHGSSLKEEK